MTPALFQKLIAPFPLITYPAATAPSHRRAVTAPTLWIVPPLSTTPDTKPDFLSADVECLKWQAHLALRGVHAQVRWDVDRSGALGGRLPCLAVPNDEGGGLLAARDIPGWMQDSEESSEERSDESRAWVALLEGDVHAALTLDIDSLSPPPAPLSGLLSLVPPVGKRVPVKAVHARYHDAIAALSERLGTDTWFLASPEPTALDALAFAYLHILLNSTDELRIEVARRVNLVTWERRVYEHVRSSFESAGSS